jgi:dipeptidyl aminopeptidase/acylaminoacyl peptidase
MRKLWILLGLTLAGAHSALAAPPPVEAFGKIPQVDDVALSPSGGLVAWQDRSNKPAVIVFDLTAGKQKGAFPIDPASKLRGVQWADEGTLLIHLSMTQRVAVQRKYTLEYFRTLAVDVATGASRQLLFDDDVESDAVTGSALLAAHTARPHEVIMARWNFEATKGRDPAGTRLAGKRKDSFWVYSVFSVDTRTGVGRMLEAGSQYTDQWVLDSNGVPVARADWMAQDHVYKLLAKEGQGWRTILTQTDGERPKTAGVSDDGKSVLLVGALGQSRNKVWAVPLDGSGAKVFYEDPDYDVMWINRDGFTRKATSVALGGPETDTHWLDSKAEGRHKSVEKAFPDRNVWIEGRSEDYSRVIASVRDPSHPKIYYFVDFKTGRADIVGEEYPALAETKLGQVRTITYKARDGASIPAYLTLPDAVGEKNLPLIVVPHGGPELRDYYTFNWLPQFLASRGYAVLQPQFRGSIGFGEAFRKAGYRQWGGVMQDDVTDGVKAMIDQGVADPHRICIVGHSYGGYAALAGAAFTPDLYACAVSIGGVSDLPAMLAYEENEGGSESDAVSYWRDHIGVRTDPKVAEMSPARAAAAVRVPVLLIHGADDTVVPMSQSEKMNQALLAIHRPVKLVKLPGEDHWLSRSETRIGVLKELETFLSANLPSASALASTGEGTKSQ